LKIYGSGCNTWKKGVYTKNLTDSFLATRKNVRRDYADCFLSSFFSLGTVDYAECLKNKSTKRAHDFIDSEITEAQNDLNRACDSWKDEDCEEWARKNLNFYDDVIAEIAAICGS
jgi:hypothetical protein